VTDICACEGKFGYSWHHKWGVPACQRVKNEKNTRQRAPRIPEWIPGSSILLPEIDEL
jgi:hypothetical protein